MTNLDEIQIDEDISYRIDKFKSYLKNKYIKTNKNILIVTHMSIVNAFLNNKDLETYYPMGHLSEITNII